MKILVFIGVLGNGGTEKAACRWATGLKSRGHQVTLMSFRDGPRRIELTSHNVALIIAPRSADTIAGEIRNLAPDVIHTHVPGYPHEGDLLGDALASMPRKVPVVQTNVFGRLENPREDAWTRFRLFISWTSCVQAAHRASLPLDEHFFRQASVVFYPLDVVEPASKDETAAFRKTIGVGIDEVLLGRLSRPDPNKWTDLALNAFRVALRRNSNIKFLLREPPAKVSELLRTSRDAARFIVLPTTSDAEELRQTLSALDVVLHTSSIGESFGYGIAEPMNLGKPVITHSVPWGDQAQIELARHGECGFVASTRNTMADAILRLARDSDLRKRMGVEARRHIHQIADPEISIGRIETILGAALAGQDNPYLEEDLTKAKGAAAYLDAHQFGGTLKEQLVLRASYYRTRFQQWRRAMRLRCAKRLGCPELGS